MEFISYWFYSTINTGIEITTIYLNYHSKLRQKLLIPIQPLPPNPHHQPNPKPHKTTRTVCNHPQANLLKNISKAKITKKPNHHNSLHI